MILRQFLTIKVINLESFAEIFGIFVPFLMERAIAALAAPGHFIYLRPGKRYHHAEADYRGFKLYREVNRVADGPTGFIGMAEDKKGIGLQAGFFGPLHGLTGLFQAKTFFDGIQNGLVAGFNTEAHADTSGLLHFFIHSGISDIDPGIGKPFDPLVQPFKNDEVQNVIKPFPVLAENFVLDLQE